MNDTKHEPFWMLWVPGKGAPKKQHPTIEAAKAAAAAYKAQGGTRQCFILAPVEVIPGRRLISLKGKGKVEPKQAQSTTDDDLAQSENNRRKPT